ncbi:response regulator transcription factor [Pseudomonas tructae]|uniref:Response regulator transcription factor n=2 Tax=Pseudomonas tructae TaxID=2518644 RepID=A0A411MQ76_9PSED|nr:response regulator transcription factor [Pseudomonas tructae]
MSDFQERKLTRREVEVLEFLLLGKSNKQIGLLLDISDFTVRDHVSSLLRKHGVEGRGALMRLKLSESK